MQGEEGALVGVIEGEDVHKSLHSQHKSPIVTTSSSKYGSAHWSTKCKHLCSTQMVSFASIQISAGVRMESSHVGQNSINV